MSLLPTPSSMTIITSSKIFPIHGQQQQQQQLPNQPYLLVYPDRSLHPNYYLVYVPLTSTNLASSTSILQTLQLLNTSLTATSLYNTSSLSNVFFRKPNAISSSTSTTSIAFIRERYRYNMRPSYYRYVVQLL